MRPKANLVVLDPGSGKARPGAFVTIYQANTLTKAGLWADDDVSPIGNPVQANGLGQVAVRVNPGLYDVSMTWDGAMPTVVEDVSVITSEQVIASPGDLIIGDTDGGPIRLAVGANGQVLFVEDGLPAWKNLGSGVGLPTGPRGSLITYGTTGASELILPGLQDQALAMAGGVPTWVSTLLPPGTTLPINQPGDLVVGAVTTGLPSRLARGETNALLRVSETGGLYWSTTAAVSRGRGDCRLSLVGTTLVLAPCRGTDIWIAGQSRTLPEVGVSLAPTGVGAEVTVYIYAAWIGSAVVLEPSPTVWTMTSGLAHKTGDETRTLVGMARTTASAAWVSSSKQQFVLSYFNPVAQSARGTFTAMRTSVNSTVVEIHPEIRAEFLCWGAVATTLNISGTAMVTGPGVGSYIGLDGAIVAGIFTSGMSGQNVWLNVGMTTARTLSEGYHYVTLMGGVNLPGECTWAGDPAGYGGCIASALISGSS